MQSNLYKEALADAVKLREIAEQNAKNAIIESITPKIRELIESQIMGGLDEDDDSSILDEVVSEQDSPQEQEFELTAEAAQELTAMLQEQEPEGDPGDPVLENLSVEEKEILESAEAVKGYGEYIETIREVLGRLTTANPTELNEADLQKYIALVAIAEKAVDKLNNMVETASYSQLFEITVNNSKDQIHAIKKEINEMKRSLRDLLSEEVITIELDLGDDAEVNSEEVSVKVVEEDELIDADAGEEEGEEVEDVEAVDVETDEVDLSELVNEIEEAYMDEEEDDSADEGHYMEEEDMMESLDDETVLEIDENMLRDELTKLMQESEVEAEEVIEEASEEEEVLEETAEPVATEQNDELQADIESYQSAVTDLQSQLAEMSLFNAKLLYTNKLLMNSDLSQAQRAQAIETLDDAASLREVKLLFKTLTESFSKRAGDAKSSRNIGGASRPTQSASMNINESTEASRWALLAGIK
jgi:hypothetical protein